MTITHALSVIFPLLVIIVGGFCILLMGGQKTLRDTNGDQGERIVVLEAERVRDKATIDAQATKIEVLEGLVRNDAQIATLLATSARVEGALTALTALVNQILKGP